ncbi:hypothetical protein Nepgr_015201 [Nepenthes gracilis]|uniref:Uncharacterized protein n=1 Tax=Nepenthes gracilis TaxID=150966 RepID=A0AAD3SME2_NEPGR|nr:hypothetical protein Nepgr_015201 [Nepenthes gracilis]
MEFSMKQMALITSSFGLVSFICGVIAENKKPAAGTAIAGKDVVICKYTSNPYVALGYLSVAFLVLSTIVGYIAISYPYKKRSIPFAALFRTKTMVVFFNIAWLTAGLAAALLLWPTITEQLHLIKKVHHNLQYDCPTAKTGLIGGGAFVALDSCLFWLICLMLADNAREDYFDEIEVSHKGERSQVVSIDFLLLTNFQPDVDMV